MTNEMKGAGRPVQNPGSDRAEAKEYQSGRAVHGGHAVDTSIKSAEVNETCLRDHNAAAIPPR